MSILGQLVGEGILQVGSYGLGKSVALLFMPHLGIEPFEKQESMPPWKWRGFTYLKNGRRFLYTETIQLLGVVVLIVVGVFFGLAVKYAT